MAFPWGAFLSDSPWRTAARLLSTSWSCPSARPWLTRTRPQMSRPCFWPGTGRPGPGTGGL